MAAKILIVDDDADIRYLAEMVLGTLGGFEVVSAESSDAALQLALDESPALILLDEVMPGLDGPATLARLRADPRLVSIPVVFLTGKCEPADRERHRALGALETLAKPFDPERLAADVHGLLASVTEG